MVRRTRPGISRFSDVQLHIGVRCCAAPRNDEISSPRPACGERSVRIVRCAPGEGDSPRVELAERAPHPSPLPARAGRGSERGEQMTEEIKTRYAKLFRV